MKPVFEEKIILGSHSQRTVATEKKGRDDVKIYLMPAIFPVRFVAAPSMCLKNSENESV